MQKIIAALFVLFVALAPTVSNAKENAKEKMDIFFDKGIKLQTEDEKYSLAIGAIMQMRGALANREGAGNDAQSLMMRRSFVTMEGNFFDKDFKYYLKINLMPGAVANNVLDYGWLDYKFCEAFDLKLGLTKIAFNRQELTSDTKQQFIERSLANERFNIDRSVAAQFYGTFFNKKLEYYLTIANGRATGATVNANQEMLYAARLAYNVLGQYDYSESDIDESDAASLTFGGAATYYHEEPTVSATQDRVYTLNSDVGFKYAGFSFQSEFFYQNTDPKVAGSVTNMGFYAQAGYFVVPKRFEMALRSSMIFDATNGAATAVYFNNGSLTSLGGVNDGVDETGDADNEQEYSAAFNYYFKGHKLKAQAQYTLMLDGDTGTTITNHLGMAQLQLAF